MPVSLLADVEAHKLDGEDCDDVYYKLSDLEDLEGIVLKDVGEDDYVATRHNGGVTIEFAFLENFGADKHNNVRLRAVFAGAGTAGSLREMRHTWFSPGKEGYVFYLPINKTIAALNYLKEYFDAA